MKKAIWIWSGNKGKTDEYVDFFEKFTAFKGDTITAEVSVAGEYSMYLNGELVAFGQYPDYADYKVCDRINLTPFIKDGTNEIKIIAWHIGRSFSTCKECGEGIIYEITRGEEIVAFSSADTLCCPDPNYVGSANKIITVQLGFSYEYDFRGRKTEKVKATAVKGFGRDLVLRPVANSAISREIQATPVDGKEGLYDLGMECCGLLKLKIKIPYGERILVSFGEHVVDGKIRDNIDGRDFTVSFIGNGKEEEFVGATRRLGCRYLSVPKSVSVFYIGLSEVDYPFNVRPYNIVGEQEKSIYETSLRTLQLCFHSHYEDCPWREQSMYIMDSFIQMRCGYYAFSNPECAKSALRLMARGQKENGLFDLCFPSEVPITIPSFTLAFTAAVKEYTEYAGDVDLLNELFPAIEKSLGYFIDRIDENGLIKTVSSDGIWHFYEWAGDLDGAFFETDGKVKKRDGYDSLINAFLSLALENAYYICSYVGKFDEAFHYQDLRLKLNSGIKKTFFDESGLIRTYPDKKEYSELCNALCVLAGITESDESKRIAEKITEGFDGWVKSTLSMKTFVYDALLKIDPKYGGFILSDILKTYGKMLRDGATSFWETEKGEADFQGAGSLCHGWSAIPVYYYRILGVCGKNERPLAERYGLKNNELRENYLRSIYSYINGLSENAVKDRDEILSQPPEERRKIFVELLGLDKVDLPEAKLVKREKIIKTEKFVSERLVFDIGGILFGGILYCNPEEIDEKGKLVLTLHGGGGTPEILGDLFINSANYNHMVTRVMKKGIKAFAPQLLLWNNEIYGTPFDRGFINFRLVQLGASITALELSLIKKVVDWFEKDETADVSRLGVVGLSYGGMYALYYGAYDERVKYTYSSCWFSDRAKHCWHDWVYKNSERKFFDTEVASLVFPRKLYIEVAKNDEAFPASDGYQERKRLSDYAEKSGNDKNLKIKVFDGVHELDKNDEMLEEFTNDVLGENK